MLGMGIVVAEEPGPSMICGSQAVRAKGLVDAVAPAVHHLEQKQHSSFWVGHF